MTTTTTNYGWVKPDVGASDDVWGGYINTDLDGIDAIVKGVSVVANAAYPASNPSGYQTAAQVASVVIGDNRIINGDMRIDQRNNGASGTAVGYTVDRWKFSASQTNKGTWGGGPSATLVPLGFSNYLDFQATSAYTPLAADYFQFVQAVEADAVSDFAFGTSNAQPVTLSFLAHSTLAGTHSGVFGNGASTRSYPFTFSLLANTWTKIVIIIPGDTTGTWLMSGNSVGVAVHFNLGAGSTFLAPAGAWTAGNFVGANGSINVVATNAAQFNITGVKLEIGSVATPFNRQSLAKSMADCQRYYQTLSGVQWGSYSVTGNIFYTTVSLPTYMRAAPTVALNTQTYGSAAAAVTGAITNGAVTVNATSTATGTSWAALNFTASAEL